MATDPPPFPPPAPSPLPPPPPPPSPSPTHSPPSSATTSPPTQRDQAARDAKITARIRADLTTSAAPDLTATLPPTTLRLNVPIDADLLHGFYRHLDLTGYDSNRVVAAALLNFIDLAPMSQYHMLEELTKWEEDGEAERTGVLGKIGSHGRPLK